MPNDAPHRITLRLVTRAQQGDAQAFGELVERYRPRIFALCLHLCGNEDDADDVTQEVFLSAYRNLTRFEGRSQFFTWVYRMAVNRALNLRRFKKRRSHADVSDPRIERAIEVDGRNDPGRNAELRHTYRQLLAALDRLPAGMRATVVLVALQGLSHGEVAQIQGCSVGTIAWRIHTARKTLKEALAGGGGSEPLPFGAPLSVSSELRNLLEKHGLPLLAPS